MKNLAELKKYLQVGVELTSKYSNSNEVIKRTIIKKQSNAVQFDNGSWMQLDSAKRFNFTEDCIELLCGDEVACKYYI